MIIHEMVRILLQYVPKSANLCYRRYLQGQASSPVPANSQIAQFISTFKRFCNREYGKNIWQLRSHDHIIRNETDYQKIWAYIDTNVIRWEKDCFYK